MPPRTRELKVFIAGDARDALTEFDRVNGALGGMAGQARGFSGKMSAVGGTLTKTVTPAAAGMALAFGKSFQEFDTGADALRTKSGLMGDALDKATEGMKRVAGRVTQPLSEIGEVMGEVQARTGLVGKPLEDLTTRVLNLARITGGDARASVAGITRLFGDWSVKSKDQAGALDLVYRASQRTGVATDRLSQLAVRFGSPLRQLGFGFGETIAMLGKFEKEGVNTELVMGSLRIALGKMARAGEKDLPGALRNSIEEIKNTKDGGTAAAKALELFGARAGPDMAAAIREGRMELGPLFDQVTGGKDTIAAASKDTLDWSDKLQMLKNRVMGAVGPFGEIGAAASGALAALGPFMLGVGQVGPMFGKLGPIFGKTAGLVTGAFSAIGKGAMLLLANPIGLAIAGVVVAAVLIWRNWDKVSKALKAIWGGIKSFGGAVFGFLRAAFLNMTPVGLIIKHWQTIRGGIGKVLEWLRAVPGRIVEWFRGLGDKMFAIGESIIQGILNGIKAAGRWVLNKIPGILRKFIPEPIKNFFGISSPSKMAMGWGKAIAEGMALGMEQGTNQVAGAAHGLASAGSIAPAAAAGIGGARVGGHFAAIGAGGGGIVINLNGAVLGQVPQVVDQLRRELLRTQKRNVGTVIG